MRKKFSILMASLVCCIASQAGSESVSLNIPNVSTFSVLAEENPQSTANIVAIVGGAGLRNGEGRSRNYLVKQKLTFTNAGLNYYLLPNWENSEKASYSFRASDKRARRIGFLVESIRQRNSKPIWLVGFSRGSVDAGYFAKNYPDKINGIVLASGVYENNSRKARSFSMEHIIGTEIDTAVLVAHHLDDTCIVTEYDAAKTFYDNLNARQKHILTYTGGGSTGRECGPLNHHGFEEIEEKVAKDISNWINKLSN